MLSKPPFSTGSLRPVPALLTLSLLLVAGCSDKVAGLQAATQVKDPAYQNAAYAPDGKHPSIAELSALGRQLFFDRSLSGSGQLACASCHSPAHAYGPPNDLEVRLVAIGGQTEGGRAVPSLRYLQNVPPFSEHFHDSDGGDSADAGPTGGRTWDGRASSAHEQARIPLLAPNEMGNRSPADVVAKLKRAPYAAEFRRAFGDDVFANSNRAFAKALMALEVFQETPSEFYPYSSKYDAYLRGQVKLSCREVRGLAVFNDPNKGNCASCHISTVSSEGAFPAFSDFGHIALGVPRNRRLSVNVDPSYNDLGLCGPLRTDLRDRQEYCGLFRTPSLRNVATRHSFFHNGVFHSLREVLEFYAERDTSPQRWYPHGADGKVAKFDDLPARYQQNVNREAPFGRPSGDKPAFNARDIDDMLAFLKTLNDGYQLPSKAAVKVGQTVGYRAS
ncbi:cytochrome c peroxidase [Crenobacter sp. SG2305]|uniref:cytochrome-c peroxidase n=1 Tax=Crenobacter oryzisoli TaxID=3056844 RepID=UPI0025AA955D|nr:cytochrome c peroxidase [Crenobacter sp. SG2305]MDN0081368.1 cytochrome c peroxidase [Crenobacter sp. SG2305]